MERQKVCDWDVAEIRGHLGRCEFEASDVELIVLIWREGERRTRDYGTSLELSISLRKASAAMGFGHNTVARAADRLIALDLLRVVQFAGRPSLYVLRWDAVQSLEPPGDPLAGIPLFEAESAAESAEVYRGVPGCSRAPCSVKRVSKIRDRVPCSVDRDTEPRDTPRGGPRETKTLWQRTTDDELRGAIDDYRPGGLVRQLYEQALSAGWWKDTFDSRLRFLAIAHHSASPGVHRPMAMLVSRCKRALDVKGVRQEHEDWARRRLQPVETYAET